MRMHSGGSCEQRLGRPRRVAALPLPQRLLGGCALPAAIRTMPAACARSRRCRAFVRALQAGGGRSAPRSAMARRRRPSRPPAALASGAPLPRLPRPAHPLSHRGIVAAPAGGGRHLLAALPRRAAPYATTPRPIVRASSRLPHARRTRYLLASYAAQEEEAPGVAAPGLPPAHWGEGRRRGPSCGCAQLGAGGWVTAAASACGRPLVAGLSCQCESAQCCSVLYLATVASRAPGCFSAPANPAARCTCGPPLCALLTFHPCCCCGSLPGAA